MRIKAKPARRSKRGAPRYPLGTVAFYGPTADKATKLVASVIACEGCDPDPVQSWFSETTDVRIDGAIGAKVAAFLKAHGATSVVMSDGIIGCPHQEGIDYPEGASCPQCPYWAGRDRWTGERIQ